MTQHMEQLGRRPVMCAVVDRAADVGGRTGRRGCAGSPERGAGTGGRQRAFVHRLCLHRRRHDRLDRPATGCRFDPAKSLATIEGGAKLHPAGPSWPARARVGEPGRHRPAVDHRRDGDRNARHRAGVHELSAHIVSLRLVTATGEVLKFRLVRGRRLPGGTGRNRCPGNHLASHAESGAAVYVASPRPETSAGRNP